MSRSILQVINRFSISMRAMCDGARQTAPLNPDITKKHRSIEKIPENEKVHITFVKENGDEYTATGKVGWTFMEAVKLSGLFHQLNDYGFCGGVKFCVSCHTYFTEEQYKTLGEMGTTEEHYVTFSLDYIDGQSRLGCQVRLEKRMDGWKVSIPQPKGKGWDPE